VAVGSSGKIVAVGSEVEVTEAGAGEAEAGGKVGMIVAAMETGVAVGVQAASPIKIKIKRSRFMA